MKKIIALLLAAVFLLSLAACGGANQGGSGQSGESTDAPETTAKPKIADETAVMNMSFSAPEKYSTVQRYIQKDTEGKVTEIDVNYILDDGAKIIYAYSFDGGITEEQLSGRETVEIAGKTFYTIDSGKTQAALTLDGSSTYAFSYVFASDEDVDKTIINKLGEGIEFTDNTEYTDNDDEMYGINYKTDGIGNLVSLHNTTEETPDGDLVTKQLSWYFGEDIKNIDYRFFIKLTKDSKIEDVKEADKEYTEVTINDITYTAVVADEGKKPYDYLVQRGDDVYQIHNSGKSGWIGVTRTEESEAAFETFINSISFE